MTLAPDLIGEVVGYRAWRVLGSVLRGPRLVSLYDGLVWPTDAYAVAQCTHGEGVPHEGHHCGIYAARDRGHLVSLGYNDNEQTTIVIGEVALAGDVIPGERGWRAEKARPLRLWLAHEDWPLVRSLSQVYGIPVGLSNILAKGGGREHRT